MSEAALERGYRRALRAYPASWRARHGEEFLGVMLDVAAGEGRGKPTRSELLHLMLHGTAARVNRVLQGRRRDRMAAIGTIGGTALALVMMVLGELGRWFRWNSYNLVDHPFGAFTTPAAIAFVLTIMAFAALAAGRHTTARVLHAAAVAASIALAVVLGVTDPAIPVHPLVFSFFGAANLLALFGNPVRTSVLRRLVFIGAPLLGVFITLTSYLQGGGAQRTFWGGPYLISDQRLAWWSLELVVLAALLAAAGPKARPWACLALIPLASLPLSGMFLSLGGNAAIGLIGIQPGVFYVFCSVMGVVSAWVAWKRPVLSFGSRDARPAG
ncbi:hypothetical protein GD627_02410 [Arthrobacter yangruifuii]|uniref:Uncharacterized protein n=1 Tax=Arthrobacter yangruifuii TaxID=2606616 RepID=A0A5N6MS85_9MICC|nr:hypothetical protein [Arthrobacter yangruifuii]KAD4059954.1 hypothetical protein GD627_02410 [Arthrobacter yangruifuii]